MRPNIYLVLVVGFLSLDQKSFVCAGQLDKIMTLDALGRTARLGSLYDAQTDTFSGISILNKNIPKSFVTLTGTPSTTTRMGLMQSNEDKHTLLKVSASLSVKVLSGIFEASGSGSFIKDTALKSNNIIGAFSYETLTFDETLEIFYDEMKEYISKSILDASTDTDTHVVAGIGWGANVVVKFEDKNEDSSSLMDISANMSISLSKIFSGMLDISGKAGVDYTHSGLSRLSNYSLQIYGDVSLGGSGNNYPKNITEVLNFIQKVPLLVNQSNEGKGKELKFYLLPLEKVREFMDIKNKTTKDYFDIPDEWASPYVQMFQDYSRVGLKLNDLHQQMNDNRDILFNQDLETISKLHRKFLNATLIFTAKMKAAIQAYTTNGSDSQFVHAPAIQYHFTEHEFSPLQVENLVDRNFTNQRLKMKLVELSKSYGVTWVGRSEPLEVAKLNLFLKRGIEIRFNTTFYHIESGEDPKYFLDVVTQCNAKQEPKCFPIVVDCQFPEVHKECVNRLVPSESGSGPVFLTTDDVNSIKSDYRKIKKYVKRLETDVSSMMDSDRPPIGYIYLQFPGELEPEKLWKDAMTWKDISEQYPGDFLRVEPTLGAPLKTYPAKTMMVSAVKTSERGGILGYEVNMVKNGWTPWLETGHSKGNPRAITFYVNGTEQTPQHATIRIWKRIV